MIVLANTYLHRIKHQQPNRNDNVDGRIEKDSDDGSHQINIMKNIFKVRVMTVVTKYAIPSAGLIFASVYFGIGISYVYLSV